MPYRSTARQHSHQLLTQAWRHTMRDYSYVLITAAKNEEAYIERLLQSVVDQTCLPENWVIVSDGSTDRTDEIVIEWAKVYDFISLVRLNNGGARVFSSQAFACNAGYNS